MKNVRRQMVWWLWYLLSQKTSEHWANVKSKGKNHNILYEPSITLRIHTEDHQLTADWHNYLGLETGRYQ